MVLLSMSLMSMVIALCVLGVVLWLINAYVPVDAKIKKVINILVIIVVVVWVLKELGLWEYLFDIKI
jgi:hypothetical protein